MTETNTTPTTPTNDPTDPTVIAAIFCRLLRDQIGEGSYRLACERNAAEGSTGVCHSHDFCDANMIMAAAFAEVGLEIPAADADPELWNSAWEIAFDTMADAGVLPLRQRDVAPPTPYDVVDPDLNAIAAHLSAEGFKVTVEFPGCVVVWAEHLDLPHASWWFGTANATWQGDLQVGDGGDQPLDHLETSVPSDETDPLVIAEAITRALHQPATPSTPTLRDLLSRTLSVFEETATDNPGETVAQAHDELYRELQVALAGLKGGAL
jgi:hypothetical protein